MEPVECFGYTADIFPGSSETQELTEKLVRVSHRHGETFDHWVDRYDVQLLLDDPSVLWAPPDTELEALSWKRDEGSAFEVALDTERYQDLVHYSFSSSTTPDFLVLPGPTKTTRIRHTGVPTAEEYSTTERPFYRAKHDEQSDSMGQIQTVDPTPEAEPSLKRRRVFKPQPTAFDAEHLSAFMKEVKNKQTIGGLQSRAFWPTSLSEHLAIERTAALINSIGTAAEDELIEFVDCLKDEDRIGLGFIHKWHSLHPYYRLIQRSKYRHADHCELPSGLRSMFETPLAADEEVGVPTDAASPASHVTPDAVPSAPTPTDSIPSDLLATYSDDDVDAPPDLRSEEGREIPESLYGQDLLKLGITYDEISPTKKSGVQKLRHLSTSSTLSKALSAQSARALPRWEKTLKTDVRSVKQEGVVFLPVEIPNLGWDTIDKHPGTTPRAGRVCQEIGYELLRLKDKELIHLVIQMLRAPLSSPWRGLGLEPAEWDYLKHVVLTVLLQIGTSVQPLRHTIDSTTDMALKLLHNFRDVQSERQKFEAPPTQSRFK